jgi:hypothetical protein
MLTQILWWSGNLLQALLLLRGIQTKWVRRFPIFYSYHVFILVESLLIFGLYSWARQLYSPVYWTCEFVCVLLGSLILLEIYRVALRQYPGTARMARNLLAFVFAMALAKALVGHSYGSLWWPAKTYEEVERNLRVVQAFAILALVIVIIAYRIPRGRHLKGILTGYGLFVALSVMELTLAKYFGQTFPWLFTNTPQIAYNLALCIWTVALWVPERDEAIAAVSVVVRDHPSLVSRTREELEHVRLGLRGAAGR